MLNFVIVKKFVIKGLSKSNTNCFIGSDCVLPKVLGLTDQALGTRHFK